MMMQKLVSQQAGSGGQMREGGGWLRPGCMGSCDLRLALQRQRVQVLLQLVVLHLDTAAGHASERQSGLQPDAEVGKKGDEPRDEGLGFFGLHRTQIDELNLLKRLELSSAGRNRSSIV